MNHDARDEIPILTWKELHSATFTFTAPFKLMLDNGELLHAERIARLMPGKRMVVFGVWQGKTIVAKLFFDPANAKRHTEADLNGIHLLQENKIPTPAIYYHGLSDDKRVQVIIFEEIRAAENVEDLWRTRTNDKSMALLLEQVVVEIATQHVFGIEQHDLHLRNFLVTEKVVYTLDGGQIQKSDMMLTKKVSMENLALFLSQLGVGSEKLQEHLFRFYAKSRGWLLKKHDLIDMFILIKKWRQVRWQKYEKKIVRESSQFTRLRGWRGAGMADRFQMTPDLESLLKTPEKLFQLPNIKMLKKGRSSTVIKLNIDGRFVVVKRYNIKSFFHWLRRCIRPTRAACSWRLAHKMNLFGVATPTPIAYIENRFFGLRGTSYYIADFVSGDDIGIYLSRYFMQQDKIDAMVKRMVRLLRALRKLDISHGDLKATNILVNEQEQPVLLDLDGTVEHFSLSSLRKAWVGEIKRFLRNFNDMPTIRKQFEEAIHGRINE